MKMILTEAQTVEILCDAFSGPWLLPKEVTLDFTSSGSMSSATGNLTIDSNNHFLQMHKHGYPGVMSAEFTQQLGCVLIRKMSLTNALPYMIELNIKSRLAIKAGDTITATTTLREIRGRGKRLQFFFESTVTKDGKVAMETTFYGMPVPAEKKASSEEAEISLEAIGENFGAFVKQQAPFIKEALSVES